MVELKDIIVWPAGQGQKQFGFVFEGPDQLEHQYILNMSTEHASALRDALGRPDLWDVLQEAMGGPDVAPEQDLLALAKAVAKRMHDLEQALESR